MRALKWWLSGAAVVLVAAFGFVYSGGFNVAADEPHWGITRALLETIRERSIASSARGVGPAPKLDDPQLIAAGAEEYGEMCTGCHLAPGMEESGMRSGLYPKPPNLAEHGNHRTPAEAFWIMKHGLKMTGMPAWGVTHDDQTIWSMVAFVQKLPQLSPTQYKDLIAQARASGHHHGGEEPAEAEHEHSGDESGGPGHEHEPQATAPSAGGGEAPKPPVGESSPQPSPPPHKHVHSSGPSR